MKKKIERLIKKLPLRVKRSEFNEIKVYKPGGCRECGGLGYKGRIGIFELFEVSDEIEKAIYREPTEFEMKELAEKQGMVTMQEDGAIKVMRGITTFEEVERVAGSL